MSMSSPRHGMSVADFEASARPAGGHSRIRPAGGRAHPAGGAAEPACHRRIQSRHPLALRPAGGRPRAMAGRIAPAAAECSPARAEGRGGRFPPSRLPIPAGRGTGAMRSPAAGGDAPDRHGRGAPARPHRRPIRQRLSGRFRSAAAAGRRPARWGRACGQRDLPRLPVRFPDSHVRRKFGLDAARTLAGALAPSIAW